VPTSEHSCSKHANRTLSSGKLRIDDKKGQTVKQKIDLKVD